MGLVTVKSILRLVEKPESGLEDSVGGLKAIVANLRERLEALEARELLAETREDADAKGARLRLDALESR